MDASNMPTTFDDRWGDHLEKLLSFVHCPMCGESLHRDIGPAATDQPRLRCKNCQQVFSFINDIPRLVVEDELWQSKAKEAQGWIAYLKEIGQYGADPNDHQLPYYPHDNWRLFAQNFDIALDKLSLTGDEVILDLGANLGWASKHFSLTGCYAIAVDIVGDENMGLGRSWSIMERTGARFSPLLADGERLPINPASIDVVFCSAALHHAAHFDLLVQNIARVLKPGGKLCAINEPCISVLENERDVLNRDARHEREHGIDEHRPNLLDYYTVLRNHGFNSIYTWKDTVHDWSSTDLLNLVRQIGGVRPGFHRDQYTAWRKYLSLHLRTLHLRSQIRSLLVSGDDRETFTRLVSLYVSGGISFIAKKAN
jgi:SAM-dependent methyltransferase